MDSKVLIGFIWAASSCFVVCLAATNTPAPTTPVPTAPDLSVNCNGESWCDEFCPFIHGIVRTFNSSNSLKLLGTCVIADHMKPTFLETCYIAKELKENPLVRLLLHILKELSTNLAPAPAPTSAPTAGPVCGYMCNIIRTKLGEPAEEHAPRLLDCWLGNPPAGCAQDSGCHDFCLPRTVEGQQPEFAFFTHCLQDEAPPADCKDETILFDVCKALGEVKNLDTDRHLEARCMLANVIP